MKVSIVVPTYNQGAYIADCLQSIRDQTYRDLEVIIQDSESTDDTFRICSEFVAQDPRFRYFREKDQGQSDAINRGLHRSMGELWTWICSDDFYSDRSAIGKLVQALEECLSGHPEIVGAFGEAMLVTEAGRPVEPYFQLKRSLRREDFKLRWPLAQPSSLLLRRRVLEVGGVDPQLFLGMDLELFLKLLSGRGELLYVPALVADVRLQPDSKSVRYRRRTAENSLRIIQKHFGSVGNPFRSHYVKEYAISSRLELKWRIEDRLKDLFMPTPRLLPSEAGMATASADSIPQPIEKRVPMPRWAYYSIFPVFFAVRWIFARCLDLYFRLRILFVRF